MVAPPFRPSGVCCPSSRARYRAVPGRDPQCKARPFHPENGPCAVHPSPGGNPSTTRHPSRLLLFREILLKFPFPVGTACLRLRTFHQRTASLRPACSSPPQERKPPQ